jgi:hypothetical protein
MPLKILITNNRLAKRTGTELFAVELAEELLRRGERPAIFTSHAGPLADDARRLTIPIATRLDQIGFTPDIIHGHHAHQVVAACLRFPHVPAIFVCHGWESASDAPPKFPRIRRYLAVDHACRDRLVCESGIPEELVELHYNFVNLRRFKPRLPLPDRPRRALLFSNRGRFGSYISTLRRACQQSHIELEMLGSVGGRRCDDPENVLPQYDIVFARAKAAIEAMAVGAFVILCDSHALGPAVTPAEFDRVRELNFGRRSLAQPMTVANVSRELDRYCPRGAAEVAARIRAAAPLTLAVDRLMDLYQAVREEHAAEPTDLAADLLAMASYFEAVRPQLERDARRAGWKKSGRALRNAAAAPAQWLHQHFRRAA